MPDINPYASPRADLEPIYITQVIPAELAPGAWRMGYLLVMTPNAILPPRCAMTGGPAELHDDSMVSFMGMPIYIPVSRRYTDDTGHHKSVSTILQVGGVLVSMIGLGLLNIPIPVVLVVAALLFLVGMPIFIIGMIWRSWYVPSLTAEHITPQFLFLRGAHADFLAALPEWPYGGWRKRG